MLPEMDMKLGKKNGHARRMMDMMAKRKEDVEKRKPSVGAVPMLKGAKLATTGKVGLQGRVASLITRDVASTLTLV